MPSKDIILCEKLSHYEFQQEPTTGPFSVPSARQALPLSSGLDEKSFLSPVHLFVSLARLNDI